MGKFRSGSTKFATPVAIANPRPVGRYTTSMHVVWSWPAANPHHFKILLQSMPNGEWYDVEPAGGMQRSYEHDGEPYATIVSARTVTDELIGRPSAVIINPWR